MGNFLGNFLCCYNKKRSDRTLNQFAPRLWRVNEELAREFFDFKCHCDEHGPGKLCKGDIYVPYSAESYIRCYSPDQIRDIKTKKYWDYIEYCEELRGPQSTQCRDQGSAFYIPPFPLKHFHFF